ncbi:MAG: DMT family transporter [Actinobacteria bacterium]|nr:DMT family transporter [Actinomycetota bacterium]
MRADQRPAHERLPVVASLLALGSGVVWSMGIVTARKATHTDAFQYLIWRSIGVIAVIEMIGFVRGQTGRTLIAWRSGRVMAAANLGIFLASIAFVYAVKTTTPANAAFLSSLTPLVAMVFATFLGERLTRSTVIALAIGVAGLVVTVFGDLSAGNMKGNIAAFASSVGFALYATCVRTDRRRDWSPVLAGYCALMVVACSIITMANGRSLVPPAADVAYAIFHGAVLIVVGTLMFNAAAKEVPTVPMTVFTQTEMAFAPLWGILLLDLHPKGWTIVGGAIIFSAVVGKAAFDSTHGARQRFVAVPDVPLL